MDRPQDVPEGNLRRRAGQQVTAFFAALAFDNMLRFQLDENLNQIILRDPLLRSQFLDPPRAAVGPMPGQAQHRPGGVIALDGQFHARK